MKESPFEQHDDFVFTRKEHNKPVDNKTITEILYKALDAIGISEAKRRERNITFHSWRHAFNTYMRGKVADSKLRRMTGHKTAAMTERYTSFNLEDFDEVAQFQEQMFG
jgi:integrase